MSPEPLPSSRWSGTVWWIMVGLMLAAQLGLIIWLGDRGTPRPATAATSPLLQWVEANDPAALPLADPTLFALPHPEGFSGPAWLSAPKQEIQPFAWTEPPRFLELSVERLATSFPNGVTAPIAARSPAAADFVPELLLPRVDKTGLFATRSIVRQTSGLEGRELKTKFELPSWPHTDVLTNSVVQLLVEPEGTPFSAMLLGPGSGLKEADEFALKQARAARFAPLPKTPGATSALPPWTWGELVFEWHTVPGSNTAAAKP